MVEASKCRTYIGFIEALNDAFFIHTGQVSHINDTMWHIFSSDVGHRKIKILFMRSWSLEKTAYLSRNYRRFRTVETLLGSRKFQKPIRMGVLLR